MFYIGCHFSCAKAIDENDVGYAVEIRLLRSKRV